MKKICLSLLACSVLQAHPFQAELKLGYFYFGDEIFRQIYRQDALDTQLTVSTPVWKWLRIYGGINYISREGRSIGGHHRTEIIILPASIGLQAMIEVARDLKYYASIGPRYFYVHQENHFSAIDHSVNGHGIGGFINTGIQFDFGPDFYILGTDCFIDLFCEYSFCRIPFRSHKQNVTGATRQVGGLTFGGSLGYRF